MYMHAERATGVIPARKFNTQRPVPGAATWVIDEADMRPAQATRDLHDFQFLTSNSEFVPHDGLCGCKGLANALQVDRG